MVTSRTFVPALFLLGMQTPSVHHGTPRRCRKRERNDGPYYSDTLSDKGWLQVYACWENLSSARAGSCCVHGSLASGQILPNRRDLNR